MVLYMKLLLVDDHTLFRDALNLYLQRAYGEIDIIQASDFFEAEKILAKTQDFALVLLDFMMPGMEGLSGLARLRKTYPGLRIAIMSGVAEPDDVSRAIALGAAGYFPKTLSGKALLQGIQSVIAGEIFIPLNEDNSVLPSYYTNAEDLAPRPSNATGTDQKTLQDIKLTPREKQVLRYLLRGQPNKEIAADLGLQLVTIKLHVRGICKKLGADNRTQAALKARAMGMTQDDAL